MSMPTLIEEKKKKGKSVNDFIKRFRNLFSYFLICLEGMSLSMLLKPYRHNLCVDIKTNMCAVRALSWKEL